MSRIGVYTDCHYSQYSSIVRMRGKKYSKRLEMCIDSINWAENLFAKEECDLIVCLGDFFDGSQLNAEELTSLNELHFGRGRHIAIVGNHEVAGAQYSFNSMSILRQLGWEVINQPSVEAYQDFSFVFIPYLMGERHPSLADYLQGATGKRIVFSHNDLRGIRYGSFISEAGFDIAEIEKECDLFINGHLHNGQFLNERETILNLGNLTGQNFGEDAKQFKHYACIFDTEDLQLRFFENPYALNFMKIDTTLGEDFSNLPSNSVLTIKVFEEDLPKFAKQLETLDVVARKFIVVPKREESSVSEDPSSLVDHWQMLQDFVLEKLGSTQVIREELGHLLEGANAS